MRVSLIVGCTALLLSFAAYAQEDAAEEAMDVDPLAALAELGDAVADTGPEGGGSIRAKKDANLERAKRLKDKNNLEARVESTDTKGFPLVAISLKVSKPAKTGPGKELKKNTKIRVIPKLAVKAKAVDMNDDATRLNAGAFYLKKGDKVMVRLGANKGKYWEAEYIERK